jgi:tetratricopeptide (TPR) repeat protein
MTARFGLPAAAILFACAAASPAWAPFALSGTAEAQTITLTDIQAAQLLIANNRLEDAKALLTHDLAAKPDDSEVQFLLAAIATAQKDYDTAISLYRAILVREPDAERVRLELARVFFLKQDYDNADRQFRFARAGDIPDAVKANIDTFLSAINRQREWTYNFALALAPDTNQNAATAASQISIFGLPFALDPNARRHSGVGIAGDIGGEWSPLLDDNIKGRFGADLTRTEYGGGNFDDMTLSGYAGPQFLFSNWDASILATAFQRWYGNAPYVSGVGGKLALDYGIRSDLVIGAALGGQAVTDAVTPDQTGPLWTAQVQGTYVLSPSTLFQGLVGFNRQDAENPSFSYSAVWFGAGYQQDLPYGFSAGFTPSYTITRYDRALPAFGATRADNTLMLSFSVLNRRFDYHGFTPRFSYVFTQQDSNIALYSYTRNQFQIGVTSLF